ncbi:MAG: ATP-binding protein [Candidatus Peregrinibacteria bacterium]
MNGWFRSIKVKLLLVFLAFGLTPFIIISVYSIRTIKQEIRQEVEDKLMLFADAKVEALLTHFDVIERRTLDFATDGMIRQLFYDILSTGSLEAEHELNQHLIVNKKSIDPTLLGIMIMDLKGQVRAATTSEEIGKDYSATNYFIQGKKEASIWEVSDWGGGEAHAFFVSVPLSTYDTQEPIGVLVNAFDANRLQELLSTKLGYDPAGQYLLKSPLKTLEVYIVNKWGTMFIHPDANSSRTASNQDEIKVNSLPVQKCLKDSEPLGSAVYQNYQGEEVIGVSVCFPEREWVVLSEVSTSEAFWPLWKTYIRLGFAIALFFLTILLLALVISRKVTEPLTQVTQVIGRVREGDLQARIQIDTQDEIGALSRAFNETVAKLGKSHLILEKKVKEKTKELQKDLSTIAYEKAKADAILESIGDGIVATDAKGKIVRVNPVAQNLLNWNLEKVRGADLTDVLKLQDQEGNLIPKKDRPFSIALSELRKVTGTYYCAPEHLPVFPMLVTVTPVLLEKEAVGVIMVFRDVTREKEVERMKTEFVSLVSHQLRTPLSGMKWFAEMLRAGDVGILSESQKEFVDNINELNERMIALVNALLNIARIESGRIIIDPKPTRLADLVHDVLKTLQASIDEKKLNVVVSINDHLPIINVDPKLIREVYSNLINNAVKYTPDGGEIIIFVSEKEKEIISQVSDTGFGIPRQEQHKIFQKFFRASNISTVETEGNGLGLYLVNAIVEASGGKAWFKSEENQGTSFFFSLSKKGSKAKKGEVSLLS